MGARRRDVMFAAAAAFTVALVPVMGNGAPVGAGLGRPAPAAPPSATVDNPITGASVPDAVYRGSSAPKAVEIGNRAPGVTPAPVVSLVPKGIVLSV